MHSPSMFSRLLNPTFKNSFFLFGARGTGKSTFLRSNLDDKETYYIDLLKEEEFLRYATTVGLLEQTLTKLSPKVRWVVIDEVQKLPKLLDEVHRQLFNNRCNFALTGSSARKLKQGKANMLAGRAFTYNLYPLTHREADLAFDLNGVLSWGSLPGIYRFTEDNDKFKFLQSYAGTYVKEEVVAEQLVRGIIPFQKFLPIAAHQTA